MDEPNNENTSLSNYVKEMYKSFRETVLPIRPQDSVTKKYSKNFIASLVLVLLGVLVSVLVIAISLVL